jgi:L-asparaginase
MDDADRDLIRRTIAAQPHRHVLVTHGTDTMVETARALAGVAGKTIVLTGALNPARFQGSDAVFNIGCAVGAIQALPDGVYIAMNGRVWDPARVRKNREANRFEGA